LIVKICLVPVQEAGLMEIVRSLIEVGFMTVISAYIDLFIRGELSGYSVTHTSQVQKHRCWVLFV